MLKFSRHSERTTATNQTTSAYPLFYRSDFTNANEEPGIKQTLFLLQ